MIDKQENILLFKRLLVIIVCNALMGFGLANVIASTQANSPAFVVLNQQNVGAEMEKKQQIARPSRSVVLASIDEK